MNKIFTMLKSVVFTAVLGCICALTLTSVKAANVEQTDATGTTASILWDAPDNSACYYIGYGDTASDAEKMVKGQKHKIDGKYSSYVIKNLTPGKKYYVYMTYKVSSTGIVEKLFEDLVVETAPDKVTGVKVSKMDYASKTATLSWKTQGGASGYEYVLKDNSGKEVTSGKISSGTESLVNLDIKLNSFYRFQVRAYFNRFGRNITGDWSAVANFAAQPQLTKVNTARSGLTLKWNKITGAKDYTVYVSKSPDKGYKKVGTTTKTSYTVKNLSGAKFNKSTNYYVYIIANKSVSGKTASSFKAEYSVLNNNKITSEVF